jgi:hypothetical protein
VRGNTGFHYMSSINTANGPDDGDDRFPCDGRVLHVAKRDGFYEVWLNTEVADFDGVHIGEGETREAAVADAVRTLESAATALQLPYLTEEETGLIIGGIPLQALPEGR